MATPKENRSWKSGKKKGRKKKANPQVFGLFLTLFVLAAILVWAIWPRPMTQLQLFVISADEAVPYDGKELTKYHTAATDSDAVFDVFSKLAEKVQSVVSARNIPVSKLKGMSADQFAGKNRIGIVFLNAFSRTSVEDEEVAKLRLVFGSDRQSIGFEELINKFSEAEFREIVLLLEVSHERPEMSSHLLAVEGPALLEAAIERFTDSHPELKLTVISSTSALHSSYPHLVRAAELPGLEEFDDERQVIAGTAFGQTVAEVFQQGDFWTIDDLAGQLSDKVEKYVASTFRGEQSPQRFATYKSEEPIDIFREKHEVTVNTAKDDETESEDEETAKTDSENDGETKEEKLSTDEELVAFQKLVIELTAGYEIAAFKIADLLQLNRYAGDMQYALHHADIKTFRMILDRGERLALQIQSAAKSMSDVQQESGLQLWIPRIDLTDDGETSFFSDVLAEVNNGENQRSASLVEKLKEQAARDQLVASFLATCKLALQDIDIQTPEATKQRFDQVQEWRTFIQRLAKTAGWHDSEWPHQFLLAYDLLTEMNAEWSDEQFKSFLKLQRLRSQGLQFASGWKLNGKNRLYQNSYTMIAPQLERLLKETAAAERNFLLGHSAIRLMEKHLVAAGESLDEIQKVLDEAGDRYDFLTEQRLRIFNVIEPMARVHNSIILSPGQLATLSRLSDSELETFSVVDFPQASFSRKISRDDASALLQLTDQLTSDSPQQAVNETQVAINRFRDFSDAKGIESPIEDYETPMVHQGIWLSFWSIRALQALDHDQDVAKLIESWTALVQAIANEDASAVIAAKRALLAWQLHESWQAIGVEPIVVFQPVQYDSLQAVVSGDLERHAQFAGSRYSGRYRRIFGESPQPTQTPKLPAANEDLRISGGTTDLGLDIPDGTLVYFFPDGVRLQNTEMRDVNGWQVGPWNSDQRSVKTTSDFSGSANPLIAVVDQDQIVHDYQTLHVGVAFEAKGWKIRFSSQGVRLPEIDLSDENKVITLPPQTGQEPLPITVTLFQPDSSFAESVMVNITELDESGEPGKRLWSKFHELSLDSKSRSVDIPLLPPTVEGESSDVTVPDGGFDLTGGFAFIVRPKDTNQQEVEVVLKVTPKFFNPLDQYLELGDLKFDTESHKLNLALRRRETIAPEYFPPEKIGAEMSYSSDLDLFRSGPPPKRPAITKEFEFLEATFTPAVHEAIRISETTIGKDRLEFGLSINGLENIAKWKLGQSEVMERIGYARSGGTNQFGNRTAIRIGMNLSNPKEDGITPHNLDGQFVLGDKWRNAILDFPLELYGLEAEQARNSKLLLDLVTEGNNRPQTLAEIDIKDAYSRTLKVEPKKAGLWLFQIRSKPHGTFGVNLSGSFGVTEGVHRLEATLNDINAPQPIAKYETNFIVEDSSPEVTWNSKGQPKNPEKVLTSEDYRGWVTVHDPQTGVVSVAIGLDEESMTTIDLKGNTGQKNRLKVPFRIEKSFYPDIPAKKVPTTERIRVKVECVNGIGMTTKFSSPQIKLTQPAASMDSGPKTGTLLIKMASKSKYDFKLTGADGKVERELPNASGTARFDDLPEGNYQLNWKKHYPLKNDGKSFKINFSKNGDVFDLAI